MDKTRGSEYRARLLHYMMFHRVNEEHKKIPPKIEIFSPPIQEP